MATCEHHVMVKKDEVADFRFCVDCGCRLDDLDIPGTATTIQQWSTPQREESRSRLPQGDERGCHGEYLLEGGEQA